MKRKSVLAVLMAVIMCTALATSAFAATPAVQPQDDSISDPARTGNPSPGRTNIQSNIDSNNEVEGDDVTISGHDGNTTEVTDAELPGDTEIYIWANVDDLPQTDTYVYKIVIEWGNMAFQFQQETYWNPLTLKYDRVLNDGTGLEWVLTCSDSGYEYFNTILDTFTATYNNPNPANDAYGNSLEDAVSHTYEPVNNEIRITNYSNVDILTVFVYAHDEETHSEGDNKFNVKDGNHNDSYEPVRGNFFNNQTNARTAAGVLLEAIYDNSDGIVNIDDFTLISAARTIDPDGGSAKIGTGFDEIEKSGVQGTLQEDITASGGTGTEQSRSVFFAFSGTPDVDSPLIGTTFEKVGIITLTFTPTSLNTTP